MKLGAVIGRVTLSQTIPALEGARWLIINPFSRESYAQAQKAMPALSKDPSLVIYDNIGGGVGETVGYVEGREAAEPFEVPPPIDAINTALIDEIFYSPLK